MDDIKEVITGLECCYKYETQPASGLICEECPYNKENGLGTCSELMLKDALELLKEHELIIRCKDCKYGLYTGIEYLCDKHSGHANRFGEDQYYKEWHNGNWFCADGERR